MIVACKNVAAVPYPSMKILKSRPSKHLGEGLGDPLVMLPFQVAARAGQFPGYAGPADRNAAEVLSKYLVTDMYAKAVQGMRAEDSVKWADGEIRDIHS
jgi:hypothetical protein